MKNYTTANSTTMDAGQTENLYPGKIILVATDFSPAALNAAIYAADMALAINASVRLVHIFQIPTVYFEMPVTPNEYELGQEAQNAMVQLKQELMNSTGNRVSIEAEVIPGHFFEQLQVCCNQLNPWMVIIGSQGKSSAERILFGSHATYAMQNLNWPLMTIPPQARFTDIKKIGLACDFENINQSIPFNDLKLLVEIFNAELHILNTGKPGVFDPAIVFQSELMEEKIRPLKPQYHFIAGNDVDESILHFAEKNEIDLLVVLPKRHGIFERLTHKSHTKQMVLHSHVPVMAIH